MDENVDEKNLQLTAPYHKSQAQFDDGKIHEFQRNIGNPVDWEMRVKGKYNSSVYLVGQSKNSIACLLLPALF